MNLLPDEGYSEIIKDCYNPLLESGRSINAFIAKGHYWYDIGTIESYMKANMDFLDLENKLYIKGKNTIIDSSAVIKGHAVIGSNVVIEKGAVIENSIIWDDVVIKSGMQIKDSIVTTKAGIIKIA